MRVDLTIIGGGPVGLFAAFYAGLRGMSVRIVDTLPQLGGQLMALYPEKYIYDMPGFPKVLAKDLAIAMAKQGTRFGAELCLGERAETLTPDGEGFVIGTASGLSLPTRTVVIAAGAGAFSPTKLGAPHEEEYVGKGLYYGVLDKNEFRGKDVVIVGGGDSALDWCVELEPVADTVTLVHRRDGFRAHEETVAKVMSSSVLLNLFWVVKELHGEGQLTEVTMENTQTKETLRRTLDALIVNVGFKSSLGPLLDWGLELEKNQIKVNERFETNLPGVYAVGDVCTYPNKLKLIATGTAEAVSAVCQAKLRIDPAAKLFPGHSSDMEIPSGA